MARIVVATQDDALRRRTLEPVVRAGFPASTATTWDELISALGRARGGLIVVDAKLPGLNAPLLADLAASLGTPPQVRVIGGEAPPLSAIQTRTLPVLARRYGAPALTPQERRELRLLGLGKDSANVLARLARSNMTVIFEGEKGTGKKRVARWLHRLSGLPGPFVVLERDLIVPEGPPGTLYVSRAGKAGVDALHHIVDEAQAADWRVTAGTRVRLETGAAGWSVLRLKALRERPDELRKLARLYLERYRRQLGMPRRRFDRALWALVRSYRWPENVRELESFIVQALTSSEGPVIRAADLPPRVKALLESSPDHELMEYSEGFEETVEARLRPFVEQVEPDADLPLYELVIDSTERALLRLVLARTGGNQKEAAELLGIARNTLRTKAIKLNLIEPRVRRGPRR
ncbi:MAG: sigma 54-interacting transcriptional regulator [Alphaproteobacteria bacterium]|nr:sigma 54-interacting transcriptional regulator [Alphaproteobacteria bacterium]